LRDEFGQASAELLYLSQQWFTHLGEKVSPVRARHVGPFRQL
jgi:hypothetical protein